jgi:hypothetical protein
MSSSIIQGSYCTLGLPQVLHVPDDTNTCMPLFALEFSQILEITSEPGGFSLQYATNSHIEHGDEHYSKMTSSDQGQIDQVPRAIAHPNISSQCLGEMLHLSRVARNV